MMFEFAAKKDSAAAGSHLVALEDVADHLGRGADDLHGVLAVARHRRPPPRHDDEQVADVGDVGDAAQRVVHHDLLKEKENEVSLKS